MRLGAYETMLNDIDRQERYNRIEILQIIWLKVMTPVK